MSKNKLYRCFDKTGKLLYVGVSISVLSRICGHKSASDWFDSVETIKIESFKSREEALVAEKKAIIKEMPVNNIQHHSVRKLSSGDKLDLELLSMYLSIPLESLSKSVKNKNFPIPSENTIPETWIKWRVDMYAYHSDVRMFLEELRGIKK
ncbi:MAG: hypothetical protein DI598_20010 [Pseudopedobacter saltans]|uniref:GIY-YIG domain-containing protein n=1 Tax=Pseudopedobacter saltans TaxID=151895 RepID=A0A2W5E9I1_9SPHI|nr:MAG: hypothetical protein DI598_20010 [Pseudopedobacter saltans]